MRLCSDTPVLRWNVHRLAGRRCVHLSSRPQAAQGRLRRLRRQRGRYALDLLDALDVDTSLSEAVKGAARRRQVTCTPQVRLRAGSTHRRVRRIRGQQTATLGFDQMSFPMIHLSRKTRLTCALWLVLAAGCAQLPPATMSQQIGTCEKLSIVQGGKEVESTNGVFRLDRQSFIVRYRGAEKEPALAASPTNNLVDALQQRGRKELWASGGDLMAFTPNDLPLVPEFQIFVDEKSHTDFGLVIGGEEYVELLRNLIAKHPELDTATYIPKAGAGFEPGKSGAGYAFDVRTIDGQPIAQTRFSQLYVAYFGTVDRFAPPVGSPDGWRGLIKVNWGACVLAFEK